MVLLHKWTHKGEKYGKRAFSKLHFYYKTIFKHPNCLPSPQKPQYYID